LKADWAEIQAETVALLQSLIRFNTTNPPGNELPLAQYIHDLFTREGIESRLLIPAENRAAVIARIPGNRSERPVILLAHMDVVGVEAEKWSCDPFGGVIRDGYVYGRGAFDDKGMLAANVMTMLLVQRGGEKLTRDLVFVATSDEEGSGDAGIRWLVANHRDVLDAEFAINEGGRTRIIAGGKRYLAIQVAEKVSHMASVTARGPAGHASVPLEQNAIFKLGRALERLSHYSEPLVLCDTTRTFFRELARVWSDESERKAMLAIASTDGEEQSRGAALISRTPMFNAVVRNTFSPTVLAGGVQGTVIPAEVHALLNVRTIPGHSVDDVVRNLSEVIEDKDVEVAVASRSEDSPPSDANSAMFKAIAESAKELDSEMAVVPYLGAGATDSAALRRIGINAYGILPFPMTVEDEKRMHGHDERLSIESLMFGVKLIHQSILRVGGLRDYHYGLRIY
jgi:acetylornithine deacetylase/succinyl-diaminopimelate desuccinylase-like protein